MAAVSLVWEKNKASSSSRSGTAVKDDSWIISLQQDSTASIDTLLDTKNDTEEEDNLTKIGMPVTTRWWNFPTACIHVLRNRDS